MTARLRRWLRALRGRLRSDRAARARWEASAPIPLGNPVALALLEATRRADEARVLRDARSSHK